MKGEILRALLIPKRRILKNLINDTVLGATPVVTELIIEDVVPEPKLVFAPLESVTGAKSVAKAR